MEGVESSGKKYLLNLPRPALDPGLETPRLMELLILEGWNGNSIAELG